MTDQDATGGSTSEREFIVVAHPDAAVSMDSFEQIARQALSHPAKEELFPPRGHEGKCRICGVSGKMSEEHLPPRGVQFLRRRNQAIDLADWFTRQDLEIPARGPVVQGGISGYMLCRACNSKAGKYAREYQDWARGAAHVIRSLGQTPEEIDRLDAYPYVTLSVRDLYPARLVRAVLAMMLAASGSPEMANENPVLRELVLGGAPGSLPDPMRLFMVLYAGPHARVVGGPGGQGVLDAGTGVMTRMLEVAYPPLAFQLVLEGDGGYASGVDISSFTEMELDDRKDFQIEGLMIGFGHTPYPGDYRTRAKVIADSEVDC